MKARKSPRLFQIKIGFSSLAGVAADLDWTVLYCRSCRMHCCLLLASVHEMSVPNSSQS